MTCVAYKTWQDSKCKSNHLTYKFYVKKKQQRYLPSTMRSQCSAEIYMLIFHTGTLTQKFLLLVTVFDTGTLAQKFLLVSVFDTGTLAQNFLLVPVFDTGS
jgi:hypothetical protein